MGPLYGYGDQLTVGPEESIDEQHQVLFTESQRCIKFLFPSLLGKSEAGKGISWLWERIKRGKKESNNTFPIILRLLIRISNGEKGEEN